MIRPRHPRSLARPSVALVSVLALLAFACFPVLAQAETVYEVEQTNLPGPGGGNPPSHHNNPGGSGSSPQAGQSTAPGAGGGGQHSHMGSSQSPNGSSETNPSSPGGGSQSQGKSGKGHVGAANPAEPGSVQPGETKSATSDSGGSSPLVPILIAIAVLAAISVGAVLFRQRRGSPDGISLKRG